MCLLALLLFFRWLHIGWILFLSEILFFKAFNLKKKTKYVCCLMFCVWQNIAEWFCLWYVMYIEEKNMHVKTRMRRTLLPFDVSQILNIVQLGRCRCCCGKFVFKPRLIFIHVIIPKMISLWTDFRLWRKRVLDGVSSSIQSVSLWAQPKPLKRTKSYRNCFRKECTRIENGWPACLL